MNLHPATRRIPLPLLALLLLPSLLMGQLLPGDQTDSSNRKAPVGRSTPFEVPDDWKAPYLSTYYVKPTVSPEEVTTVSFFVTDWENSKIRHGDDTHRFDVSLRYTADGTNWTRRLLKGVPGGDHTVDLGKLPAGDYTLGLLCTDEKGRASHTVWHEFRSRSDASPAIPADKIRRMTAADLAAYSIRNDGDHGRLVPVEVGALPRQPGKETEEAIRHALDEAVAAGKEKVPADGYVIYAAAHEGVPVTWAWRRSRTVYGSEYDKGLVETNALRTSEGLQRLVDDAAEAGFRTFVFLPGTYRLSHRHAFTVPDGMTIDLNGATLKMNGFTGDHAVIARIHGTRDSHLVNGVVEGDYYEHDYEHSPHNSEWPMGIEIKGDARHCSFEGLTVRNITGYGAGCGMDFTFPGHVQVAGDDFTPGALRTADGTVDPAAAFRFTSGFRDLSAFTNKYVSVSKYLGYQGIRTRSWLYTAAFYDADKRFLSAERGFQYRAVLIPDKARYMRVTLLLASAEEAKKCELSAQLFKVPWNCAFKGIRFERCRAVGMAPAAMRNMLIEGNDFSYSGENLARCAFDAEDGWDLMQDVTIRGNRFHDNPNNELLTCAGHNFVIEGNEGDIHLWGRTLSPCVRSNVFRNASFCCDTRDRTMHGRYLDNDYRGDIRLGNARKPSGWDIVISQDFADEGGKARRFQSSPTGRFLRCRFSTPRTVFAGANFDHCTFDGGEFIMTFVDFTFLGNDFQGTRFSHCNRTGTWERCTLRDCHIMSSGPGVLSIQDSVLAGTRYAIEYWTKPVALSVTGSSIDLGTNAAPFVRPPLYSIDRMSFTGNTVTGSNTNASFLELYDTRKQPTDARPASLSFVGNTVSAPLRRLVRISDIRGKPVKDLTITARSNALGPATELVNTNGLRSHWKAEIH